MKRKKEKQKKKKIIIEAGKTHPLLHFGLFTTMKPNEDTCSALRQLNVDERYF